MALVDVAETGRAQGKASEASHPRLPDRVEALFDDPSAGDGALARPGPAVPVLNIGLRYDLTSMALHWASALIVLALFTTGWARGLASSASAAMLVLTIHRSTGVLLWTLTLARLAWKLAHATQPPLPSSMSRLHRLGARTTEWLLYGMLRAQPVSGLAFSAAVGKSFVLLGYRVPILMERNALWLGRFEAAHEVCGIVMATLVGAHAIAAIHHHFIKRDTVLLAMLGQRRRRD